MAEGYNDRKWDGWNIAKKTITFDGGTANAIGDHDGTGDPFTIATVTGVVVARVFGVCTTNLAGASATVEVGTADTTAGIIAQTTATDIDAGEIWHDASPDSEVEAVSVATENFVTDDVVGTVATANITAGVIDFYILWKPLSLNSSVTIS